MFKQTKRRLVILNVLVFFILQNIFGISIYFYMKYSLYRKADQTILAKKTELLDEKDKIGGQLKPELEENRQLVYLLWETPNKLYQVIPKEIFSKTKAKRFSPYINKGGLQSVIIGEDRYRFITFSVSTNTYFSPVQTIQIVYNLKSENEMLSYLLVVVGIGALFSLFITLLAGFYLANKAIIPIKASWEKQQQFVADASHELRTPLSVMKLNLERLFRFPDRSIEQESETIHQAIQEINYLSRMAADLLTLARSDSNQLPMIEEDIQLDKLLSQLVQDFSALAKVKKIHLKAELHPIQLTGSHEKLKQLFVILLDNALKYTNESGLITVKAKIKNSRAVIEISDTGVGIPKVDLPFIFDRYYRGDKARTRLSEGSGLGLSIAKWIIESHNGKIRVESKAGEGTHVFVTLPLKKKH